VNLPKILPENFLGGGRSQRLMQNKDRR